MFHYTVYKTTNTINGKIYIGMHKCIDPFDDYFGSGVNIRKAIDKHGVENFKKEVLFDFDNYEDMKQKEKEIVTEEFCQRSDTYNIATGGTGGSLRKGAKLSEETRLKISETLKKTYEERPELLRNLSEKRRNRVTTEETRALMRQNRTGKVWLSNPETETTKHVKPEEVDYLIASGWIEGRLFGTNFTPEVRKRASDARARSLTIIDTGVTYGSYKKAAVAIGRSPSYVQSMVKSGEATFNEPGSGF